MEGRGDEDSCIQLMGQKARQAEVIDPAERGQSVAVEQEDHFPGRGVSSILCVWARCSEKLSTSPC